MAFSVKLIRRPDSRVALSQSDETLTILRELSNVPYSAQTVCKLTLPRKCQKTISSQSNWCFDNYFHNLTTCFRQRQRKYEVASQSSEMWFSSIVAHLHESPQPQPPCRRKINDDISAASTYLDRRNTNPFPGLIDRMAVV